MAFDIEFKPSGRGKAQNAPDPDYPAGKVMDCSTPGNKTCAVALPYPASECGAWVVRCDECSMSVAVTAAGRPDDPISITMNCKISGLHDGSRTVPGLKLNVGVT